jgi:hypothetical protein
MSILQRRIPGATLTDSPDSDPDSAYAQACRDRDAAEGAAMYWEQQAGDRDKDADRMAAERDQAIVERDDHAARSLPHLDTPDWPETDQPVGALIGDELADQYGGWWE